MYERESTMKKVKKWGDEWIGPVKEEADGSER